MKFSLIICTYNRFDILQKTLPSILELDVPVDVTLEVIVVDNNSIDETPEIIKVFIKSLDELARRINGQYIFEGQQGLSYARNTGYLSSNGDYVAYIDDECILPNNWLVESHKIIVMQKPAFLGGPYYGKYLPDSSSAWFKESFGDSYILQYDLKDGPLQRSRSISGGNMFVRRDVFEKIGLFDESLGMSGEVLNYGEELEFQKRFIQAYPDEVIWYDSKVFVWHLIRDKKMKLSFLIKDALIRGRSAAELKNECRTRLVLSPFYLVYFVIKALLLALLKAGVSVIKKEHFFLLLYEDYKNSTWRDIGGAWYKTKKLFFLVD